MLSHSRTDFLLARQAFVQALALAANGSLTCTGSGCGGPVSAWEFEAGILATFSSEPDFPLIAEILFLAVNASDASFLGQGGEITAEDVVAVPMECGDYGAFPLAPLLGDLLNRFREF